MKRTRRFFQIRILFGAWVLAPIFGISTSSSLAGALELDSVRTYIMEPNGINPRDIDLYPPKANADAFPLSRVNAILHSPFILDSVTTEILRRTSADSLLSNFPLSPDSIWPLLDVTVPVRAPFLKPDAKGFLAKGLEDFRPEDAMATIQTGLQTHTAGLTEAEKQTLFEETSGLFLQEEEDTARTAIEGELVRLKEEERIHRVMNLSGKLNVSGLVAASEASWRLECWILYSLKTNGVDWTVAKLKKAAGGFKEEFPIHLGSKKDELHRVDHGIWIDPGGNDDYTIVGEGKRGKFLLIVDLGGNDLYRSKDSLNLSSGNMGIQLIADIAGNDHYLGENFSFGSTLFGYASVFDAKGQDVYEARCASLGFAFFGIGMIEDESGSDVYSASLMSEGAGSTKGAGFLLDRSGNDQYLARPTFRDELRYTDHNIHMVQGFATGFSPNYSGGIGLLRDGAGNDLYVADIFGQGSAYWYALGLLIDEAGDDRYDAYQYAQGAGVHIAIGALLDFGGNDHYASKGVSQGCGHDLGFGLLYDRIGNDNYFATDMSQGAGSANGLGILQDALGNDIYESINLEMALGHADMRRDRGSFGFFLDQQGKDRYRPQHADGKAWRIFNGKTKGNGFGLDR